MKKSILIISIALILFLFGGFICYKFSVNKEQKRTETALRQVFSVGIKYWSKKPIYIVDFDEAHTRIPRYGIRGKYQRYSAFFGLVLNAIGEPIFKSGPHKDGMNWFAEDFGNYNPRFLHKLEEALRPIFADKKLVDSCQVLYDVHFKSYLRSFWASRQYVIGNEKRMAHAMLTYRTEMQRNGLEAGTEMQNYFYLYADDASEEGQIWYEANTTAVFWLRRAMDGTDKEFYRLLRLALETFDPDFPLD